MCKEFIVAAQRTDINNTNNWLNFFNLDFSEMDVFYMQNYLLQLAKAGFYEDTDDPKKQISILLKIYQDLFRQPMTLNSDEWKLL